MAPNPSFAFGELPSFADSILYPEKGQHQLPDPTTRATFQGKPGRRADPCEQGEGNIKLEGKSVGLFKKSVGTTSTLLRTRDDVRTLEAKFLG